MENNDDCEFTFDESKNPVIYIYIYGNNIGILCESSYSTIVCFKIKQHNVLAESWYQQKSENEEDEKLRILKVVADIVGPEIRSNPSESNSYPPSVQMFTDVNK